MTNSIPDATTFAFFHERLRHAGVIEELFELFDQHLRAQGYEARGGQIIYPTLAPVPKQRNTQKKNGINHFGFKKSISVGVEHGLIRMYIVTSANVHDSQMLPAPLDPTNDSLTVGKDVVSVALCCICHLQASSGKANRHRLNQGENPQNNATLHSVVVVNLRCHKQTQAYAAHHM